MFHEKDKGGALQTYIAIRSWEVFPKNKRYNIQKKRNICKIDLFHKKKLDQQLFLQIFSQVFEK